MTLEQYDLLLSSQDNKCAICKGHITEFKYNLAVDHNHTCCPSKQSCGNCIRGLLCSNCNLLLGNAQDNIAILLNAIEY